MLPQDEAFTHHLSLAGRKALVTGGARRLGRTLVHALVRAGAEVVFSYRHSAAEACAVVAEIEACGGRVHAIPCELGSEESVGALVAQAAEWLGGLDLLINNAGLFTQSPLESLSVEAWDAVFATNTRAPFLMARAALPRLRKSQGRIVNIGSLGGSHPWATHAHYCASKAALEMLTRTMAKAWAPEVSVNCIAPGWIEFDDDSRERAAHFAAKTPMQRNARPEELAEAMLFFAAGPHYITGQVLTVDGGLGLS